MRLLFVAPFERGRQSGGSQRSTAIAERLEERGATIEWRCIPPHARRPGRKLLQLMTLTPGLVGYHTASDIEPLGSAGADAVVAAQSYMAPYLDGGPPGMPSVVDFHNLEWRTLAALAGGAPGGRALYLRWQAYVMRRFEERAMSRASLSLFATEKEFDFADGAVPRGNKLLVPNALPRKVVEAAEAVARARDDYEPQPLLVYLGTLTYRPNLAALHQFLRQTWPTVSAGLPGIGLTVVGRVPESERRSIASCPGVEAPGFVSDLTPLLAKAAAVVLPFGGGGGSSLRVLFCGLAGVPVIGSPSAFRGFPAEVGLRAQTSAEWEREATHVLRGSPAVQARTLVTREVVLERQRASEPWDALSSALSALSAR
jgi:polysaccharide biosynthesis protein PslH